MTATLSAERADRADLILMHYGIDVDDPDGGDSLVSDLLADLMHYCQSRGYDWDTLLTAAQVNFGNEMDDEDDEA